MSGDNRNGPNLSEFNQALERAGIRILLGQEEFSRLLQAVDGDDLANVLPRLKESSARGWLRTKLSQIGIDWRQDSSRPIGGGSMQGEKVDPGVVGRRGEGGRGEALCDSHQQPHAPAGGNPDESLPPNRHVYGQRAALCWEADRTRGGIHTVALEGALASGNRGFDWKNKVRVQITERELPVVAAVLLGIRDRCAYSAHGPGKDKGFALEFQNDSVFVRVLSKGKGIAAVPMPLEDAYQVLSLVLRQLRLNSPWMSVVSIIAVLKTLFRQPARGSA